MSFTFNTKRHDREQNEPYCEPEGGERQDLTATESVVDIEHASLNILRSVVPGCAVPLTVLQHLEQGQRRYMELFSCVDHWGVRSSSTLPQSWHIQ